jgi:hypothetical protein
MFDASSKSVPISMAGITSAALTLRNSLLSMQPSTLAGVKNALSPSSDEQTALFALHLTCSTFALLFTIYSISGTPVNFQHPCFTLLKHFSGWIADDTQEMICDTLRLVGGTSSLISLVYLCYKPTLYYTNIYLNEGLDMPLRVVRTTCILSTLLQSELADLAIAMAAGGFWMWQTSNASKSSSDKAHASNTKNKAAAE